MTGEDQSRRRFTGGCLCGALRYEAEGAPLTMGYCFCADCRKASGSGFVPFMGFSRSAVTFSGQPLTYRSKSVKGSDAVRNFCAVCGGLVFGGELGISDSFTIYAGALDEHARLSADGGDLCDRASALGRRPTGAHRIRTKCRVDRCALIPSCQTVTVRS